MTDREYILKNCYYVAQGMQGPEAHFESADGYHFTCIGSNELPLRYCKGELTERLIASVLKNCAENNRPIQPTNVTKK